MTIEMLTPDMEHDIPGIYPMYNGIRSPRPLDAFSGFRTLSVSDD